VAPSLAVPVHVASFSASPSTQTYSLRKWLPEVPAGDDIKNPLYSVLHPLGHMTLPGCITEATLPVDWHTAHGTSWLCSAQSFHSPLAVVSYSSRKIRPPAPFEATLVSSYCGSVCRHWKL
jgi:hypothetical protein